MALPPLHQNGCTGRNESPKVLLDAGQNPDFKSYGCVSWEPVPAPSPTDTGDLGSICTPQQKSRSPKKKKKPEIHIVDGWHHKSGIYDENSSGKIGDCKAKKDKDKDKDKSKKRRNTKQDLDE
eukprot:TRINITY_DN27057_c0_g1_i1.p1 TRINITY_DN27057_c0_g1~~TRINITY_DN27057_c0_g1_i1.p1  ORF type:complete len:123 (+),score=23.59 TRINITY_DN27057_c0_g1_i1:88-456(+)